MFRRVYGAGPLSIFYRFHDQFEEDGKGGYIYRLWRRGRPIAVTAEERRTFINSYTRNLIVLYGLAITAGITFFAFYLHSWYAANELPSQDPRFWVGLILSNLPFLILLEWVGYAPARALKSRPSIGPEPTTAQVQADRFNRLTYGHFALIAFVSGGSYIYIQKGDWDRHWLFVPILGVLLPAIQAFRKFCFELRQQGTINDTSSTH